MTTSQAIDLEALAAAVAQQLGLAHALPPKSSGPGKGPMDTRGIEKHGRSYRITRKIRGYAVREAGFASRQEAAIWADRLERDPTALASYLRGREDARAKKGAATVNKCLAEYMAGPAGSAPSARLMRRYRAVIEGSALGEKPAELVRQGDVDAYLLWRRREGGVGEKTAWNELGFLRAALRYAWRCDLVAQAPRFVLPKPRSVRRRVYSDDELGRMLELADVPLRRAVLALASTGMRRGEICAARWAWVRELPGGLRVLELPAEVTKTDRARTVPLGAEVWGLLQQEPRDEVALFARWRRGRNGQGPRAPYAWHEYALWQAFKALAERAGVDDAWLHDFRRTVATAASEADVSEAVVQTLGGWAAAGALRENYTHARVGATGRLVASLEARALQAQKQKTSPMGEMGEVSGATTATI